MKRIKKEKLKEDELVIAVNAVRDFYEQRSHHIGLAVVVIAVIAAGAFGVYELRHRSTARSEQLLADAMVALNARVVPATESAGPDAGNLPAAAQFGATGTFATEEAKLHAALPKLKAAADAYPDSPAGITARYHYAGALASLGQYADALKQYDEVEQKAGKETLYGRMAELGKADTELHAGQVDTAITTWKQLAAQNSADLPQDAILMQLARAYEQKGNTADAKKTFNELVDKHPQSPYTAEARQELESLKG
ncbi:MAG TPA: tetratricopeptide repeat protein [Vicinamibacterales bacterium]|nr:tetratricopeptide repeat protein [Vicinamibacterales bacterium]